MCACRDIFVPRCPTGVLTGTELGGHGKADCLLGGATPPHSQGRMGEGGRMWHPGKQVRRCAWRGGDLVAEALLLRVGVQLSSLQSFCLFRSGVLRDAMELYSH